MICLPDNIMFLQSCTRGPDMLTRQYHVLTIMAQKLTHPDTPHTTHCHINIGNKCDLPPPPLTDPQAPTPLIFLWTDFLPTPSTRQYHVLTIMSQKLTYPDIPHTTRSHINIGNSCYLPFPSATLCHPHPLYSYGLTN